MGSTAEKPKEGINSEDFNENPITEDPTQDPITENIKEDPVTEEPKEDRITIDPKENSSLRIQKITPLEHWREAYHWGSSGASGLSLRLAPQKFIFVFLAMVYGRVGGGENFSEKNFGLETPQIHFTFT